MKKTRIAAGLLSVIMLVGIPCTFKAAAADEASKPQMSYATTAGDTVKVTADSLNIRKSASNTSDIVGLLHKGDTVTITDTKKDSRGVTWGQLKGGKGWINLDFTSAAASTSYKVTVTASSLNVRKSASTKSDILSTLKKGATVTIVAEQKDSNGTAWGQLSGGKGWICLKYTKKGADDTSSSFSEYSVTVTANSLNIRKTASNTSAIQGTLSKNDKVTIVAEQKDSRGVVWGKLSTGKGWINLNFTTKAGETKETFSEYSVKVTANSLNIRKTASNTSAIQGTLSKNDKVTIVAEQKDSRGVVWGKLSTGKGWINLNFTTKVQNSGSSFTSYSVTVTADTLNIRKSASNTSDVVGFLKKGNVFTIVAEKKDSRGVTWGKLENGDGWINLNFTKKS